MKNQSVRDELVDLARELYQTYREVKDTFASIEEELNFLDKFFNDYKSSYSLSLAYPESLWIATAEKLGITTEGKDRLQLAKEVYARTKGFSQSDGAEEEGEGEKPA